MQSPYNETKCDKDWDIILYWMFLGLDDFNHLCIKDNVEHGRRIYDKHKTNYTRINNSKEIKNSILHYYCTHRMYIKLITIITVELLFNILLVVSDSLFKKETSKYNQ